jgi:PTH2 family peptidyl-tRNA hydrolase
MKQMIVLRTDLNMRKGKMVAQGAHASMAAILNLGKTTDDGTSLTIPLDQRCKEWLTGNFKKVCVGIEGEEAMRELYAKAQANGMIAALITDSGLTEFHGNPTITALAIGPDKDERFIGLTDQLKLL